jgi:hypothetical protein
VRHSWGTQAFSIEPNQIREDVADQISRESGMYCTIFCGFDFDLPFSGTADTFEFSLETQEGIHPWCVLVGSLEGENVVFLERVLPELVGWIFLGWFQG